MTDTINVPRELLHRIEETAICDGVEAGIDGDLFNELVALLQTPAQPAQVQGWQMVKVNEAFSDLVNALERADRKGYLAEALIESWEAFDYEYADAAAPKPPVLEPSDDAKDALISVLADIANTDLSGADDSVVRFIFIALQYRAKAAIDAAMAGVGNESVPD